MHAEPVSSAVSRAGARDNSGDLPPIRVVVRCRPPQSAASKTAGLSAIERGRDRVSLGILTPGVQAEKASEPRHYRCHAYLGSDAAQDVVFQQVLPHVERATQGLDSYVLCYGASGSGKTYTLLGSPEWERAASPQNRDAASPAGGHHEEGIIHRAARRIFEYDQGCCPSIDSVVLEASFARLARNSQGEEKLVDLLSGPGEEGAPKEDEDASCLGACVFDRLRKVHLRSYSDLCNVWSNGARQSASLEELGYQASLSHSIFTLAVEALCVYPGSTETHARRGRITFLDLAASAGWADQSSGPAERGVRDVVRDLECLLVLVHNAHSPPAGVDPDLSFARLVRECVGRDGHGVMVAHVRPELEHLDDTVQTLSFAQLIRTAANGANSSRIDQEQAALLAMRMRHSESMRLLQGKVIESREDEMNHREKMEMELEGLRNTHLQTKESAEKALANHRDEHFRKIDEMREGMTLAVSQELEKARLQSVLDMDRLRQMFETRVGDADLATERQREEHEVRLAASHEELREETLAQRAAEAEACRLRLLLVASEERANMLYARQDELRQDRVDLDQERKRLRQQNENQWDKMIGLESNLQKFKAEAEVQRLELVRLHGARSEDKLLRMEGELQTYRSEVDAQRSELARLHGARAEDAGALRQEQSDRGAREEELQRTVAELRASLEGATRDARRDADAQAQRIENAQQIENEQRESTARLRLKMGRFEGECASQAEQLCQAQEARAQLEAERSLFLNREEAQRQQSSSEAQRYRQELEQVKAQEAELRIMLSEVQDGIILASADAG